MRFPALVILASAWLFGVGGHSVIAQSVSPPGSPQIPPAGSGEQRVKPPAVMHKEPIRKLGGGTVDKTPVILPRSSTHPHKPMGKPSVSGKATTIAPAPSPMVPISPRDETKISQPEKLPDPERPEGIPTKLPRFASLRSDDVNMRAGPGTRYRINWVYKRRELPVEIEREFDVWRWVRDADGIQGWVNQATLTGRRSFIVEKAEATLRADASDVASAVAILKPGVIGRIRSCEASSDWCNVQSGSYRGYLRREQFWGALPREAVGP